MGTEKGSEIKETATYTYDDKGRLLTSEIPKGTANQNKGIKATYVYGDDGRLMKIVGAGILSTRTFEYDEKGRISKQINYFGAKPMNTSVFEYDAAGAPIAMKMLGRNGKLQMGFELTYDDKINPLVGTVFANATSLFLGHPLGNYSHNIVSRKRLGAKAGAAAKPNVLAYTYNDSGYPLTITEAGKDPATMTYDCK